MLEPFGRWAPACAGANEFWFCRCGTQGHWMRSGAELDRLALLLIAGKMRGARRDTSAAVRKSIRREPGVVTRKRCRTSMGAKANLGRFFEWSFRRRTRTHILRAIHLFPWRVAQTGRTAENAEMEPSEVRLPYGELGGCRIRRGRGRTETLLRPGFASLTRFDSSGIRKRSYGAPGSGELPPVSHRFATGRGYSGVRSLHGPVSCQPSRECLQTLL